MQVHWKMTIAGVLLALLLLLAAACEDSGLFAPEGASLTISANPASVVIDLVADEESGETRVVATLVGEDSRPLSGYSVTFETDEGVLHNTSGDPDGGLRAEETSGAGEAVVYLTMSIADGNTALVTARSAAAEGEVEIDRVLDRGEFPPEAEIDATPSTEQTKGRQFTLDASDSDPRDADGIGCYSWTITTDDDGGEGAYEDEGQSLVVLPFTLQNEQTLSITLRVGENTDCTDLSPEIDTLTYDIVCDTTEPDADAGGNQTQTLPDEMDPEVTFLVDGRASSDPESGIVTYIWTCESSTPDTDGLEPGQARCSYTSAGEFTARLTVINDCGQSASDEVTLNVNDPPVNP
ncbi:MAG: hypothetical protein GY716_09420 [bacterium]|nr:hypothetical protein [bacterium]